MRSGKKSQGRKTKTKIITKKFTTSNGYLWGSRYRPVDGPITPATAMQLQSWGKGKIRVDQSQGQEKWKSIKSKSTANPIDSKVKSIKGKQINQNSSFSKESKEIILTFSNCNFNSVNFGDGSFTYCIYCITCKT